MKTFDKTWYKIPKKDRPREGEIFICAAPSGPWGWVVAKAYGAGPDLGCAYRGWFVELAMAELFAEALEAKGGDE